MCFIGLFSLLIAPSCGYFLSCRPFCHLVKVIEYAQVARFELISSGFLAFERAQKKAVITCFSYTHKYMNTEHIFVIFLDAIRPRNGNRKRSWKSRKKRRIFRSFDFMLKINVKLNLFSCKVSHYILSSNQLISNK